MLEKLQRSLKLFFLVSAIAVPVAAQNVIEDEGVGLSRVELEYLVKNWSPDMQNAAANDKGDRVELLNMALASKKIALAAESVDPSKNPDAYWRHIFAIRNIQREFAVKQYIEGLQVPDMSVLAQERYQTEKKKYAFVPEERLTSHILIMCIAGNCERAARRPEAEKILAELDAGADFAELARTYSEDTGNKSQGGKFDHWMKLGEANVDPHYTGGAYSIAEVGGHSGLVETRFGFHIIRLDDRHEAHYKPYEEVKDAIIADLEGQYIQLAAKEFDARYRLTDKAYIDGAAVDEILAPYKEAAVKGQ